MLPIVRTHSSFPTFVNRFFNDNWLDNFTDEGVSSFSPSVNISENDKGFDVEVVAPGVDKKDFKINIDDKRLTISYEHKDEKEEKDENKKSIRREYSVSSFSKSFSLPDYVNGDKISAKYDNGILKVNIPKEKEQPKLSRMINIS